MAGGAGIEHGVDVGDGARHVCIDCAVHKFRVGDHTHEKLVHAHGTVPREGAVHWRTHDDEVGMTQSLNDVTDGIELGRVHLEGRLRVGQVIDRQLGEITAHGDVAGIGIHDDLVALSVDPGERTCRFKPRMVDVGRHDRDTHVVPVESQRQFDVVVAVVGDDELAIPVPQSLELVAARTGQGSTTEDLLDETGGHLVVACGYAVGLTMLQGGDDTISWFHTCNYHRLAPWGESDSQPGGSPMWCGYVPDTAH